MILSISRRTDIPAFYSDWFFKRLKAGFVEVRNPMNPKQTRRISLNPSDVQCIVFWTKNPKPMLARLLELAAYKYYFQFTLNPYDSSLEPGLAPKAEIVKTFKRLSENIG
jgi:hypothetical protein